VIVHRTPRSYRAAATLQELETPLTSGRATTKKAIRCGPKDALLVARAKTDDLLNPRYRFFFRPYR
jgi:hypothetical protein